MNGSPLVMPKLKHSFYDRGGCSYFSAIASAGYLQLSIGKHTVFEQWTSPSYQNHFHIKTKTASKPTDAIYQIVKYLTNITLIKG
jgi:hypothetical protein